MSCDMPAYMLVYSGSFYPTLNRFAAAFVCRQIEYQTILVCRSFANNG